MTRFVVLLASGVATCVLGACSGEVSSRPIASALPQVVFGDAPVYARFCSADGDGVIAGRTDYTDMSVTVDVLGTDPLRTATIALDGCPQAVAIGQDNLSRRFILVAVVDYETDSSSVLVFTDTDGDDLPDSASEATIDTLSASHVIDIAYSQADKVMYVVDALGETVYRYADSSGDNVPDSSTKSTMVGPGGVLGTDVQPRRVLVPSSSGVTVWRSWRVDSDRLLPFVVTFDSHILRGALDTVTDTNSDGVADQAEEQLDLGDPEVTVLSFLEHGDADVRLRGTDGVVYDVIVESSAGSSTLATFTADGFEQTIALSRALDGSEQLIVELNSGGQEIVRAPILGANETFISHRVDENEEGSIREGSTVVFHGTNIMASVTAKVALKKGPPEESLAWVSVTVSTPSADELSFTMPDLGIDSDSAAEVIIHIDIDQDTFFEKSYTVRGD